MPVRITATKNLPLLRYEGEGQIDRAARDVRARFATTDKYQIYDDKRQEALRFMDDLEGGAEPQDVDYPYLSAETGLTAATMVDLAGMWIAMDLAWKQVAALIEKVTISAKAQIRTAGSQAEIDRIVNNTTAVLDVLGTRPPQPPQPKIPGAL